MGNKILKKQHVHMFTTIMYFLPYYAYIIYQNWLVYVYLCPKMNLFPRGMLAAGGMTSPLSAVALMQMTHNQMPCWPTWKRCTSEFGRSKVFQACPKIKPQTSNFAFKIKMFCLRLTGKANPRRIQIARFEESSCGMQVNMQSSQTFPFMGMQDVS